MKKILSSKFTLNNLLKINKSRFSFQQKQSLSFEDEIKKSFSNLTEKFHIDAQNFPITNVEEHISLNQIEKKYYQIETNNDIDSIIKKIYQEEILNMKKGKEIDDLIIFIKNCKKYNYNEYLTDVKYFKDKEIRKQMTNTSLLESIHQKKSPYSLEKEFQAKFKVQKLYKLRKGEKGEKLDSVTQAEFEKQKYEYLNYLSETSRYTKINNMKEKEANRKEIKQGEELIDRDEEGQLDENVLKKHYLYYLKEKKKEQRSQSLGLSQVEEEEFNKRVEDNIDELYTAYKEGRKPVFKSDSKSENESQESSKNASDTIVVNDAERLQDGNQEAFPFDGKDDYDLEEFYSNDVDSNITYNS
jgi:hypothetical protein